MENFLPGNIKNLRRRQNLSQEELAGKLEITRNKVASYERGSAEPKLSIVIRFADQFEVTVDDLITKDLTDDQILLEARQQRQEADSAMHSLESLDPDRDTQIIIPENEVLERFIHKNQQIDKMLEGFKAFMEIHKSQPSENGQSQYFLSSKNLLYLLNYLLKTNKELIQNLNNSSK